MISIVTAILIWLQTSEVGSQILKGLMSACSVAALLCFVQAAGFERQYRAKLRLWRFRYAAI